MITTKQKMALRAEANSISTKYTLGKKEITENFIDVVDKALEAKELIKVNVLQNVETPIREIAFDVSSKTHSEIVQIIGKVIVLYRKSKKVTVIKL